MNEKKTISVFIFSLLLMLPMVMAATTRTCTDNSTLNVTDEIYIDGAMTSISENITCSFGCENSSCEGSFTSGDSTSVWLVYGIGSMFLVLGTLLGIPFGKISGGEKDIKKPFNTTIVVRYMFFFIGLYLVYTSLGMAKRLNTLYGSENISTGVTTAIMTMRITLLLFLFVFVAELLFYIIKYYIDTAKEKKWGNQES